MRNLITLLDHSTEEIERILQLSSQLKAKFEQGVREPLFAGRVMALLFEKPSLRTRVSFEAAMTHLGGGSMFLGEDVGWGSRESVSDFARVLGQYVDVIVCRSKEHCKVEQLAEYADCCVINGLTDWCHPCQALADVLTLREIHGPLAGKKLAYVGDANNTARSLAVACGKLGAKFSIACPQGYEFDEDFLSRLNRELPNLDLQTTHDPTEAVADACGVYTDVWASMGQESQQQQRQRDFADYQINAQLMSHAPSDASFLHCLPAHRGEEVTDEVIDGPNSAVFQQAANRMHAQKGLLAWLLGNK